MKRLLVLAMLLCVLLVGCSDDCGSKKNPCIDYYPMPIVQPAIRSSSRPIAPIEEEPVEPHFAPVVGGER